MEKKVPFWRGLRIKYREKIRPNVVDYKWIILAGFGIFVVAVGYYGFWLALGNQGYSGTDLFFVTISLFLLQTTTKVLNPSFYLEFARFAALILGFITIFFIILTSFYDKLCLAGLKYRKRFHVIVCGMGYIGPIVARRLLNQGYIVLIIEKDENNPTLDAARDLGALVLPGDATQISTLEKAGIKNARYLFALTGDDSQNIKIYMESLRQLKKLPDAIFTWYTHIEDPGLFKLFASEEVAKFCPVGVMLPDEIYTGEMSQESHFFNIYWIAASCFLKRYPFISDSEKEALKQFMEEPKDNPEYPVTMPEPPDIHLLIIGIGTFGESLLLQAAFDWWIWYGRTGKRLKISVLDKDAEKLANIEKEYRSLTKYCEIQMLDNTIPPDGFLNEYFFKNYIHGQGITHIYICFASENLSLRTAVHFRQNIPDPKIPIIFRTLNAKNYNNLFENITKNPAIYENLHAYPLIECDCCLDRLFYHGIEERLAMNIHHQYCASERRKGRMRNENSSLVPWSELPEDLKESNRRQARSIPEYIERSECTLIPLCDWDTPLFRFRYDEIEILAEREHENFVKFMKSLGWVYAPGPKNREKKTNPTLIPSETLKKELPGEPEKDRDAVRSIPRLYAEIGWRVVRKDEI